MLRKLHKSSTIFQFEDWYTCVFLMQEMRIVIAVLGNQGNSLASIPGRQSANLKIADLTVFEARGDVK